MRAVWTLQHRCWFKSPAKSLAASVIPVFSTPRGAQIVPPRLVARHCSTRSPSQQPREALSVWTITITALLIGGGVWIQDKYLDSHDSPAVGHSPSPQPPPQEPFLGVIDTLKMMPTEAAPGTVGNLTAEQEAKLQEFWLLILKVFGVQPEGLLPPARANGNGDAATQNPAEDKKPKRRGWALWGRSDDDDAKSVSSESGITSSVASISITDGDDKFDQSKEFQQALAEMSPEELRTAFWNMVKQDNPDSLVLRFLRARKWDVKKALIMLISTMRWRMKEVHLDDDIMINGEALALQQSQSTDPVQKKNGDEFLTQIRLGKNYLHGVDRMGRPICVIRARLHRASDQEAQTMERYTVYTIETARLLLAPPVETATLVFDMTDFTLANMDYAPVKFMIKCFEANYPESLGSVLIHKAPWIFSSIWNMIKGWLDPVVAAKINFTQNRQDLEQFIPADRLPKELEGDEDWEYEYIEVQKGENASMDDMATRDALIAKRQALAKAIQDATIDWIRGSFKQETEAASAAQTKRKELIEQLRHQYWDLDPHIRARSLYDRLNIIQAGGKIEFYPGADNSEQKQNESVPVSEDA